MREDQDGLGPVPHPIPIVHGIASDDIRQNDFFAVRVMVVEHGWPEVAIQQFFRADDLSQFQEHLGVTMDRCIRELLSVVGRRHGVWVAHVRREPWGPYFDGGPYFDASPYDGSWPRAADGVRRLAMAASEYQPLILFDPNWTEMQIRDEPYTNNILRSTLRQEDVEALGVKALGGRPPRRC